MQKRHLSVVSNPDSNEQQKFPWSTVALTSLVMTGVGIFVTKVFEALWSRAKGLNGQKEQHALPPAQPVYIVEPQQQAYMMPRSTNPMLSAPPVRVKKANVETSEAPPAWFVDFEKRMSKDVAGLHKEVKQIRSEIDNDDDEYEDDDE